MKLVEAQGPGWEAIVSGQVSTQMMQCAVVWSYDIIM